MIVNFKEEETEGIDKDKALSLMYREEMLYIYYTLYKMEDGFSISTSEFWEDDIYDTMFLYKLRREELDEREKQRRKSEGKHNYKQFADDNDSEMNEMVTNLQE